MEVVAVEQMSAMVLPVVEVEVELYAMLPILLFPVLYTILLLVPVVPGEIIILALAVQIQYLM